MIRSCNGTEATDDSSHHAHCDGNCELVEMNDAEFEFHVETMKWHEAGLNINGLTANAFDLMVKLEAVMSFLDIDEDALHNRILEFKTKRYREMREEIQPEFERQKKENLMRSIAAGGLVDGNGRPLKLQ